ncbi:MAG: Ig domain-containing protein, partial [Clostridia bacterium]|nr:Ig domain-containing protein [Clostridia bacterium]
MRKSTRLLAMLLAVLMIVSAFPVSAFAVSVAESGIITAVDPNNEYVWETKFPYNYEGDNKTEYWSKRESYVETPTFYDTIPATVDGVETTIPVTGWTLVAATDKDGNPIADPSYDGRAIGATYTFSPEVSNAFTWECEVPEIKAKIVDAGWTSRSSYQGFLTGDGSIVEYVVRGTGSGSSVNEIYDATGCNKIVDFSVGTGLYAYGGKQNGMNANDVQPTKTGATVPSTEATKLVIYGTTIKRIYAGGKKVLHNADTNTYVINSTVSEHVYAAGSDNGNMEGNANVYIIDSTVGGTLYGGGAGATLEGNAYLDITGNSTVGGIQGGGSKATSGTTFVKIHGLTSNASIGNITRTNVTKLVVELDDTSKYLLSSGKIAGITTEGKTDANVTVKINNEEFTGVVDDADLTGISAVITKDDVLPTQFGGLSGFTWDKDTQTVGMNQKFTLTAPDGYFINDAVNGLVKTKEYTITVNDQIVEVTDVIIDQDNVNLTEGKETTLTATVKPDNANDKTVTWSTEDTTIVSVDSATGKVTALAEGVATVKATSGSVSDTCTVTVTSAIEITDVNTEDLVLETVFPYADRDNATSRWSDVSNNDNEVAEPKFYPTLSVLLEGETEYSDLAVEWVCEDYDSKTFGTYEFVAKPPAGYEFADGKTPVITVRVVDGSVADSKSSSAVFGFVSGEDLIANLVVKGNANGKNEYYDATGFNRLTPIANSSSLILVAGVIADSKGIAGKTAFSGTTTGNTGISVVGANVSDIYGGNRSLDHNGDAYIDISGKTVFKNLYGGGSAKDGTSANVSGTTYVTFHDLEIGWSLNSISRGTASAMVIDVDNLEYALEIFSKVTDWTNVTAMIDGKEVTVVSELDIGQTEFTVPHGTALADVNLPTSFTVGGKVVNGFTWEGEYIPSRAGTYVLTLTPPEDTLLLVDIYVTVTVEAKVASKIINSVTTQTATLSVDYGTSTEDVIGLLPTEFLANDGTLTVNAITWEPTGEHKAHVPGEYTFVSVLTDEDYAYADGVEPFKAIVTVKTPTAQGVIVTEIDLPVNYTVFTKDTGTVTVR